MKHEDDGYQHGGGVPPVLIEQSIAKHGDLCDDVEKAVEHGEEEQQPYDEAT